MRRCGRRDGCHCVTGKDSVWLSLETKVLKSRSSGSKMGFYTAVLSRSRGREMETSLFGYQCERIKSRGYLDKRSKGSDGCEEEGRSLSRTQGKRMEERWW